mgnify:CR=1 FL=1
MVFSSGTFLFLFLPLVLLIYYNPIVRSRQFRNVFLLFASILFYAWGEPFYVLLMLGSIAANWLFGLWVARKPTARGAIIVTAVFNLSVFFLFKYFDFAVTNCNNLLGASLPLLGLDLPIGISFFTFQAMSYVIDVRRKPQLAQRNVLNVGLYIACFPQLIAGPIVRYESIAVEIKGRTENWAEFCEGLRRFLWGLAKKVLLANQLALAADAAFESVQLSAGLAWVGAIAYTLQIYFDFSGYSDMAIGLGKLFGFHFLENFRYPYAATSITDFWRRWHISLSSWFRDYVYIPLGGNRVRPLRHLLNLLLVWLLTGLWHGANWTFVLWGLSYFLLLMLEKYTPLHRLPTLLRRGYTLLAVVLCWVLFRAETPTLAAGYLRAMFGGAPLGAWDAAASVALSNGAVYFVLGVVLSFPLVPWLAKRRLAERLWVQYLLAAFQLLVFLLTVGFILSSAYDPFIYFNF